MRLLKTLTHSLTFNFTFTWLGELLNYYMTDWLLPVYFTYAHVKCSMLSRRLLTHSPAHVHGSELQTELPTD